MDFKYYYQSIDLITDQLHILFHPHTFTCRFEKD